MPTSIDPQPAENEIECARCGAYFHYELARCPNCGVNLYEPEDETEALSYFHPQGRGIFDQLKDMLHKVFNKPYAADEVFGDTLDQAVLYNDLLQKTGGDHAAVERLIDFERGRLPSATRMVWLKNAIQRGEKDNHS